MQNFNNNSQKLSQKNLLTHKILSTKSFWTQISIALSYLHFCQKIWTQQEHTKWEYHPIPLSYFSHEIENFIYCKMVNYKIFPNKVDYDFLEIRETF